MGADPRCTVGQTQSQGPAVLRSSGVHSQLLHFLVQCVVVPAAREKSRWAASQGREKEGRGRGNLSINLRILPASALPPPGMVKSPTPVLESDQGQG